MHASGLWWCSLHHWWWWCSQWKLSNLLPQLCGEVAHVSFYPGQARARLRWGLFTYFKILLSSARNYFFFWPNFFILIFRNIYQAFERDLRNLYSLSIEFSFFKAISFAWEKLNLCENEFWATQHLQIKGWHKCKSCETSKRLHRLHLSLYLWDCICWNSLSNFL